MHKDSSQSTKEIIKNYTVIRNENKAILFQRDGLRLHPIDYQLALQLEALIQRVDDIDDTSSLWDKINEITLLLGSLNIDIPKETKGIKEFEENKALNKLLSSMPQVHYLHKMAINVSNACNLRCTYCYANQGVFNTPEEFLMSAEDIELSVRRFAEKFDYIENVQFMGGEPSLNPIALEKTVHVFRALVDEGKLKEMPRHFGMVSNGVNFTQKFHDVVKEHKMGITFSLDGPKEVHDAVRKQPGGQGSYDKVRENIKRIKDLTGQYSFEATFSKQHINCGMSLIDLCQWFFDEFGTRILHAPIMHSTPGSSSEPYALSFEDELEEMCAVTNWGLENLLNGQFLMHSFTSRILESFQTKRRNMRICMAGSGLLTVSTKGDVFPCFMLTDQDPFYMGSIKKDDFLGVRAAAVLKVLDQFDLLNHPECQKCWVQPLCFGCKGGNWQGNI